MRGQMEILGLVVIIVLFIFGGLLYVVFSSKPADMSLPETRESAEVASLLNSVMKLTPCEDTYDSLDEIIKNCYIANGNSDYCNNASCKDYISNVVRGVTSSYDSNTQYMFNVTESSGRPFMSGGMCNTSKRMAADSSIRVGNKVLRAVLTACSE